jgi:hypothetical protein
MKSFTRTAVHAVIALLSLFLVAAYSRAQNPVVDSINFKGATNIFVPVTAGPRGSVRPYTIPV